MNTNRITIPSGITRPSRPSCLPMQGSTSSIKQGSRDEATIENVIGAIEDNDLALLKRLINKDAKLLTESDGNGYTPATVAARKYQKKS